jgi:serine palmitoyltransferase
MWLGATYSTAVPIAMQVIELNFMPILQVISKVGDLVGIKYFPVEQEKTTAVELKKIQ